MLEQTQAAEKMTTISRKLARLAHWLALSMSCMVYVFCHFHLHRHILCGAMNVTIIIPCQYLKIVIHHHFSYFSKYATNIASIWICHLVYIIPSCVPVCSNDTELSIPYRHLNSLTILWQNQ